MHRPESPPRRALWRSAWIAGAFLSLTVGAGPADLAGQAPFWADLADQGPHAVGFRVVPLEDDARPYRDRRGRPLPVYLWYPAVRGDDRISYGRYVELMADEAVLGDAGEDERRARRLRWQAGLDRRAPGLGERFASLPVAAQQDAERAPGAYPLVVYAPGAGGSALENVALAELLASRGFVVAALPTLGADSRGISIVLEDLQSQARDVSFVVGRIGALPGVRGDSVVVAGWSWGGLAAMMAQMTDERIGGVVSIDGSIALHRNIAERYPGFTPSRADVPYLFFVAEDRAGSAPGFFEEIRYSDAYYVSIPAAGHADFTTRFGYLANEARAGTEAYDESVRGTYRTFLLGTAAFVAGIHAGTRSRSGHARIDIVAPGGAPAAHRPASPAPPPTFRLLDTLRDSTEVGLARYRALKEDDPSLRLVPEWDLVQLAFDVFNVLGRPDDAIAIGRLLVDEYPNSYAAHGYLAELYRKHADWAPALAEFGAASALAASGSDAVWTTRRDDLAYYRRMIAEIEARLAR